MSEKQGTKQNKIYIITSGDYSDYRIRHVFSSKKLAEEFIDRTDDDECRIEVFDLDAELPERKTILYEISIYVLNKNVSYVATWRQDNGFYYNGLIRYGLDNVEKGRISFFVESDSRKRAIKIASERFGAVIANEKTCYPYLFKAIVCEGKYGRYQFPCYDFFTKEVVISKATQFEDDFYRITHDELHKEWENENDVDIDDFIDARIKIKRI